MSQKYGLGRGLGSLIPQKPNENNTPEVVKKSSEDVILKIDPQLIQLNPHQPRETFSEKHMEELINSIREHGIIQPLVVTQLEDGTYQLIAGERRLRASKFLELKEVPVVVRNVTEQEKLELALIENIQRQNLNPLEKAKSFDFLMKEFDLTQEEMALRVGQSRPAVANTLRLLTLPAEIQQALKEDKITEGHARAILAAENPKDQMDIFKRIVDFKLNVRDAEKIGRKLSKKPQKKTFNAQAIALEEELQEQLGTKIEVKKNKGKGFIKINFFSEEEFSNIIDKLKNL